MFIVKLSREQAQDVRSGRAWATKVAGLPIPIAVPPATAYAAITARLAKLRAAVATNRRNDQPLADTRRHHEDLDRTLAHAIAYAFAADAHGVPTPEGIASWAAEGLARSYEREIAIFASIDVSGLAEPMTTPSPRW